MVSRALEGEKGEICGGPDWGWQWNLKLPSCITCLGTCGFDWQPTAHTDCPSLLVVGIVLLYQQESTGQTWDFYTSCLCVCSMHFSPHKLTHTPGYLCTCTDFSRNQWGLKNFLSDTENNTQRLVGSDINIDIIPVPLLMDNLKNVELSERWVLKMPRATHCSSKWYYLNGRTEEVLCPVLEWKKCCRPCHRHNTQPFAGPVLLPPQLVKFPVQHLSLFLMSCLPWEKASSPRLS